MHRKETRQNLILIELDSRAKLLFGWPIVNDNFSECIINLCGFRFFRDILYSGSFGSTFFDNPN